MLGLVAGLGLLDRAEWIRFARLGFLGQVGSDGFAGLGLLGEVRQVRFARWVLLGRVCWVWSIGSDLLSQVY